MPEKGKAAPENRCWSKVSPRFELAIESCVTLLFPGVGSPSDSERAKMLALEYIRRRCTGESVVSDSALRYLASSLVHDFLQRQNESDGIIDDAIEQERLRLLAFIHQQDTTLEIDDDKIDTAMRHVLSEGIGRYKDHLLGALALTGQKWQKVNLCCCPNLAAVAFCL